MIGPQLFRLKEMDASKDEYSKGFCTWVNRQRAEASCILHAEELETVVPKKVINQLDRMLPR